MSISDKFGKNEKEENNMSPSSPPILSRVLSAPIDELTPGSMV
jgi:hypothetical protein